MAVRDGVTFTSTALRQRLIGRFEGLGGEVIIERAQRGNKNARTAECRKSQDVASS